LGKKAQGQEETNSTRGAVIYMNEGALSFYKYAISNDGVIAYKKKKASQLSEASGPRLRDDISSSDVSRYMIANKIDIEL
jgi:hypothetical protein